MRLATVNHSHRETDWTYVRGRRILVLKSGCKCTEIDPGLHRNSRLVGAGTCAGVYTNIVPSSAVTWPGSVIFKGTFYVQVPAIPGYPGAGTSIDLCIMQYWFEVPVNIGESTDITSGSASAKLSRFNNLDEYESIDNNQPWWVDRFPQSPDWYFNQTDLWIFALLKMPGPIS